MRWLLTCLLFLVPSLSHAAISYVATTNATATGGVTTVTKSVTVSAGSDRLLTACVYTVDTAGGGLNVTSVKFNGTESFTKAIEANSNKGGIGRTAELWYLVNPTVTTADVVATWANNTGVNQVFSVIQYAGVSATSTIDATAQANATTGHPSVVITTVAADAWIQDCVIHEDAGTFTPGGGQTERADISLSPNARAGTSTVNGKASPGNETMDHTAGSSGYWALSTASFLPSGGGGSPPPPVSAPTTATLRWTNGTDNVGVTGTVIRRCTGVSCTPTTTLTTVAATLTTYVDETLAANTVYCYSIANFDAVGNTSSFVLAPNCNTTGTTYRNTLATYSWVGVADNTDIGANWDESETTYGPAKIVSQRVVPTTLNTEAHEVYTPTTPGNDQWCQITIGAFAGAQHAEMGCDLRITVGATISWYTCNASRNAGSGKTSYIADYQPAITIVASESATTWAAGDKLRCEAEGTTLRLYRIPVGTTAQTLVLSGTDADHASGKTGLYAFVATGGTLTNIQLYDFAMGEFSTTPSVLPTITNAVTDATGSTLTYGPTTPTSIRVTTFTTQAVVSSVVYPISSFPAGRFTQTWLAGLNGVCFFPIDALGIENNTVSSAYQCDTLVGIVQPLDTTPPVLSACLPSAELPAGTTSTVISCVIDKNATAKYDTTDTTYALMANSMTTASLVVSATVSGLTDGSTTTYYVRGQSVDMLDGEHPNTSSTVITVQVRSSPGADTTPPSTVVNLVANPVTGSPQAILVWSPATDAGGIAGYVVYQATGDCVTYTVAQSPVPATSTLVNLSPSAVHCWVVRAIDTSNNLSAADSNIATMTISAPPDVTPPSAMTNLVIVGLFTESIQLGWDTGTDSQSSVTSAIEQCTVVSGEACSSFASVKNEIADTTLTVQLAHSTRYCFRGKHTDGTGNHGAYSETVCGTTLASGLPTPRLPLAFGTERTAADRNVAGTRTPRP